MIKDPTIFNDIADALNINEPAFVEKDYYATQLLKLINSFKLPNIKLVFCGGTCLSKAYQNTYRMSEDLDFKITDKNTKLTRSHRKKLCDTILSIINQSNIFKLSESVPQKNNPKIMDVYRTQVYEIQYPKYFTHSSLKPYLKLEMVEGNIYEPTYFMNVSSIYSSVTKQNAEINRIECVSIESIIVEKLVALLWRISAYAHGSDIERDEALIRHLYDIYIILSSKEKKLNKTLIKTISSKSLEEHSMRYKNKHPYFYQHPKKALLDGFNELKHNSQYQEHYKRFLSPLVYSIDVPDWDKAFKALEKLYKTLYYN